MAPSPCCPSLPLTHILFKGLADGKVDPAGTGFSDVVPDHLAAGHCVAIVLVGGAEAVSVVELLLLNLLGRIGRKALEDLH